MTSFSFWRQPTPTVFERVADNGSIRVTVEPYALVIELLLPDVTLRGRVDTGGDRRVARNVALSAMNALDSAAAAFGAEMVPLFPTDPNSRDVAKLVGVACDDVTGREPPNA
jgi:hypothetical protein